MRAFGVDPDAISKLGQRREPTDVNKFVAAALQAAQAQETARSRKAEELEDQEELRRAVENQDEEASSEAESEGASAEGGDSTSGNLGTVLPGHLQGKLAGIMGRLGSSLDPEASSLLSQLLPDAGLDADGSSDDDEKMDGTTDNLAELLQSVGSRGGGLPSKSFDLEDFERQQKEREERMEKAAAERKAEMARRQAERDAEHEKFEKEMEEREEQRKKDRAKFEESRRQHEEYMKKVEARKKDAEERRAQMEEKRVEREARMEEALRMAHEHMEGLGIKATDSRSEL